MTKDELIENFSLFDDWEDRYRYLIDLGRQLPDLPADKRTDAYKVEGCMSQVWLVPGADGEGGRITFRADSDSAIVKGLIAVLMVLYDRKTPREILDTDPEAVLGQLDLGSHISPNRRNGFYAMVERIKKTAHAAVGNA
jgi:cysteine desulfuration protein SufE